MTISPDNPEVPEPRGRDAEDRDERHSLADITRTWFSSWATTMRVTTFVLATLSLAVLSAWLFSIEITLGPLHVGR